MPPKSEPEDPDNMHDCRAHTNNRADSKTVAISLLDVTTKSKYQPDCCLSAINGRYRQTIPSPQRTTLLCQMTVKLPVGTQDRPPSWSMARLLSVPNPDCTVPNWFTALTEQQYQDTPAPPEPEFFWTCFLLTTFRKEHVRSFFRGCFNAQNTSLSGAFSATRSHKQAADKSNNVILYHSSDELVYQKNLHLISFYKQSITG